MRSKFARCQELELLPIIGWVSALALALLFCRGSNGQTAPTFPAAAPPAAAPAVSGESKVESYPLTAATREVLTAWQQRAAGRTDIHVAIDERTSQALVIASPSVQAQIKQELAAKIATPAPPAAGQPIAGLAAPSGAALWQLRQLPAGEVHTRLEALLERQLPSTVDASGEWQSFNVEASPGVGVAVSVNARLAQIRIDGPPAQVAAWRSVIEALDSPPTADNRVTKIVATKPASHDRVKQALQVLKAEGVTSPQQNTSLVSTILPQNTALAQAQPPAGAAAAPPIPPQPSTQVAPSSAQTAIDAAKLAEASGLLGPVQVEFVEGLDVIVLRGSEKDVQRVQEIIKQIEDLSKVTVPAIEIYPLKNVDSVRIADLLRRLYDPTGLLGSRIGSVSITPLGKPNALLLIGRTENVRMAIDLIERLDKPVVPTARFEVFQLKHAAATEAKTLIDNFLGQGVGVPTTGGPAGPTGGGGTTTQAGAAGQPLPTLDPRATVVADARTNSLIVSASPRDMAEVAALIDRIDTPGASAELKVFTVVNGDAQALTDMLRSLFSVPAQPQGGGGGGGGGGAAAGAEGGGIGQGGPVRMQFSVDPRTNSIIAVGTREDLVVVQSILLLLDQGDLRERETRVYRLNNAFAQNVAVALNEWLQTERQTEQQPDLALSPFEQIEREVIIVPELATNSLIVSATPRFFKEVLRIIKELDERPPMVLIQVLIAQVQLNDTDQFGVELGLQDKLLFDRSLLSDVQFQNITTTNTNQTTTETQTIISASGTPGFNFNTPTAQPLGNNVAGTTALAGASKIAAQGLSNFAVQRVDPTLGFSGFVFSASSDAVSVLLRALQEKRRLEVLSRPQLMALDNQPGIVQVGQDVPTINAVSLTQFGQTNSILYRSVGLILQVVPRISPDGLVVMQITANKSQVSPDPGIPISIASGGQVVSAPRIDVSQALTTVSALSGQTVILGGLIETSKSDIHRRVPIVADIPLIGDLFRYDSVAEERRELLIILTPQIVYNKVDSDLVKQIESSRMSWILGDVINVHGEAGLRSRCDEWYDGEMESIYPNYMPEEGLLPLSKGQLSPSGEPTLTAPNCEPGRIDTLPTPVPTQTPSQENLPSPRLSPTSGRPPEERYSTGNEVGAVRPARYLAPPLQMPGADR
jgi:type II secretory pathway component GspD/PulD (secretin)